MKYINGLDSLRGIAALLVIVHHFGPKTSTLPEFLFWKVLLPDGTFGVDLFFVLSGFLITGVLLEARENSQRLSNGALIKNFVIRRALRLFPVYYLLLFCLYIINYPDIRANIGYFASYTSNLQQSTQSKGMKTVDGQERRKITK